ncbi:hypothetical protein, partial [Candidatus Venteria ishoeyi]|uniref:hypothetical protein n=1 Tax=Candidatus Venteria ishoeyi TaxID=1899563 RepID=UPI0015B115C0
MQRFAYFGIGLLIFSGLIFFILHESTSFESLTITPTEQTNPLTINAPANRAAKSHTTSPPISNTSASPYQSRLINADWTQTAAETVVTLNAIFFEIYAEENPQALETQLLNLERLGKYPHLMPFIERHPEATGLLMESAEPDYLVRVLDGNCYQQFGNLLMSYPAPADVRMLSEVLYAHSGLICRLAQSGLMGMETLFIFPRNTSGAKAYSHWLAETLNSALNEAAEKDLEYERLSTLRVLLQEQGGKIRRRIIEDEKFRYEFPNRLWPMLLRISREQQIPLQVYLDEAHLWSLLALTQGKDLLRNWVWLVDNFGRNPAQLLFGQNAYPQALHSALIKIITQKEAKERRTWLIWFLLYGRHDSFVQLVQRDLSDIMYQGLFKAMEPLAAKQNGEDYKKLDYYVGLSNAALVQEFQPEPIAILPGQDMYYTAKKIAQGRDVSVMEVGFAAWDAMDTGMMLVTLGGSAALTTLLKQGAKQGTKQGLETAAKNSGKQLAKKFRQEMIERLSKAAGKNLGKNTQKAMLKSWTKTQFLQKMHGLLLKQTAKKTAKQASKQTLVEITPMT